MSLSVFDLAEGNQEAFWLACPNIGISRDHVKDIVQDRVMCSYRRETKNVCALKASFLCFSLAVRMGHSIDVKP